MENNNKIKTVLSVAMASLAFMYPMNTYAEEESADHTSDTDITETAEQTEETVQETEGESVSEEIAVETEQPAEEVIPEESVPAESDAPETGDASTEIPSETEAPEESSATSEEIIPEASEEPVETTESSEKEEPAEETEETEAESKEEVAAEEEDSCEQCLVIGETRVPLHSIGDYSAHSILGNAWYYGIVANTWTFNGEAETTFAVNTMIANGGQTGLTDKGSGSPKGFFEIGSIEGSGFMMKGQPGVVAMPEEGRDKITSGSFTFTDKSAEEIASDVSGMRAGTAAGTLAGKDSFDSYDNLPSGDSAGKITLDFTALSSGTYVINAEKYQAVNQAFHNNGALTIKKNAGQKIAFSYPSSSSIYLQKFIVEQNGQNFDSVSLANASTSAISPIAEDIIFIAPNASSVNINDGTGIFLFPNAEVDWNGVGGGWIVCSAATGHAEWHFINGRMPEEIPGEKTETTPESTPSTPVYPSAVIVKHDQETGKVLANCRILVSKTAAQIPFGEMTMVDYANGLPSIEVGWSVELVTDDNGQAVTQPLDMGTYEFKELEAPEGWDISYETYTFYVHNDGTITGTTSFSDKKLPEKTPEITPESTPESTPSSTPETTPSSTPEITSTPTPNVPSETPTVPNETPSSSQKTYLGGTGAESPSPYTADDGMAGTAVSFVTAVVTAMYAAMKLRK